MILLLSCFILLLSSIFFSAIGETNLQLNSKVFDLDYPVLDAEFSEVLGKWVLTTSDSDKRNSVLIFNPTNGEQTEIFLNLAPKCVSISPDGFFAVVGHDGWVSKVSLTDSKLINSFNIPCVVGDIVYGERELAYAFPSIGDPAYAHQLDLTTGVFSHSYSPIPAGTHARLHPEGRFIYGANSDIQKYNVSVSLIQLVDVSTFNEYTIYDDLWYSEDGKKIYVQGENAFYASEDKNLDTLYYGSFSGNNAYVRWASDSTEQGLVLVNFDNYPEYLKSFDNTYLELQGNFLHPSFSNGDGAEGIKTYFSEMGDTFTVLVYNDLTKIYGVYSSPSSCLHVNTAPKTCYTE